MIDGLRRTRKDAIRKRFVGLGLGLGLMTVAGAPWPALGQDVPANGRNAASPAIGSRPVRDNAPGKPDDPQFTPAQ